MQVRLPLLLGRERISRKVGTLHMLFSNMKVLFKSIVVYVFILIGHLHCYSWHFAAWEKCGFLSDETSRVDFFHVCLTPPKTWVIVGANKCNSENKEVKLNKDSYEFLRVHDSVCVCVWKIPHGLCKKKKKNCLGSCHPDKTAIFHFTCYLCLFPYATMFF